VPLPWHHEHNAYGFSSGASWLPQPAGFSRRAVAAQDGVAGSTLEFYREALRVRRQLQTREELTWMESGSEHVLHFVRPGGWHCLANFGGDDVTLPDGVVRLTSGHHMAGVLPAETTVWLTEWEPRG
jgi:alpha-glucosidase